MFVIIEQVCLGLLTSRESIISRLSLLAGRRRSRGAVDTELKTVKPEKRVKEHPNELFTVSNQQTFCRAYRHNGHFLQHNRYIS